jgi:hypothetical protein
LGVASLFPHVVDCSFVQALNMDMYNAYMLQHQHLQHQQQHQQAANVGGGPTQ